MIGDPHGQVPHLGGAQVAHEMAGPQERGERHEAAVAPRAPEELVARVADPVVAAEQADVAARAGLAAAHRLAGGAGCPPHGFEQRHHAGGRQVQVFVAVEPHAVARLAEIDGDRTAVLAVERQRRHLVAAARARHAPMVAKG